MSFSLSPVPRMEVSHELKALKSRLSRLQEVFNSLPQQPPGPEEWPFWLEKFNALSGQFSSLERELLNNSNLLKEFLLEPSAIPQNPSIPTDSIPNILLRSKLAPEVIEPMIIKNPEEASDLQVSIFKKALLGLQEKFSIIQEDLQRAAGEHASLLLAKEIVTSSGTATPKGKIPEEDMDVILEASIRWLYTGVQ